MDNSGRGGVAEGITVSDDTPRLPAFGAACLVCGGTSWSRLPNPGRFCMASDWRLLPEPLDRVACDACGLGWRPSAGAAAIYEHGYGLYAHPPGPAREATRQAVYARWIVGQLATPPKQLVDVGCGNGSLMLALGNHWPDAALLGCDLSAESVAHGTAQGLRLWGGSIVDRPEDVRPDLLVSVNVIEHTENPLGFLCDLRHAIADGGTLVLVCPDGSRPGVELLIADHVFSFAVAHLRALMNRAGFDVISTPAPPAELGAFQMLVARPGRAQSPQEPPSILDAPAELTARRQAFLDSWRRLDGRLAARTPRDVVCFGVGETAGLLRAYAPEVWSAVTACTSDDPVESPFERVPMRRLDDLSSDAAILLAVRPADQPTVAERLRAAFHQIVTWYDLVDES